MSVRQSVKREGYKPTFGEFTNKTIFSHSAVDRIGWVFDRRVLYAWSVIPKIPSAESFLSIIISRPQLRHMLRVTSAWDWATIIVFSLPFPSAPLGTLWNVISRIAASFSKQEDKKWIRLIAAIFGYSESPHAACWHSTGISGQIVQKLKRSRVKAFYPLWRLSKYYQEQAINQNASKLLGSQLKTVTFEKKNFPEPSPIHRVVRCAESRTSSNQIFTGNCS